MTIYGPFVAEDDPDVFVYLRSFHDTTEWQRQSAAFCESAAWLSGMRDRALAMEEDYEVLVVTTTENARWPT